jgi:DNA-binding transcriptional regulator YiaG
METKDILKNLRAKTKLSQAKFSNHFNIPLHTYECWEMGIRKPPTYVIEMMTKIIEYESMEK